MFNSAKYFLQYINNSTTNKLVNSYSSFWQYFLTVPANISTLFQRCLLVDTTSRRETKSNQRSNNVVYFNVGIYNVEQCQINVVYFNVGIYNVEQRQTNVVYFNVDMNNIRQPRNNVAIFNVEFYSVGKRQNNVVKMTISKKNKNKNISNRIHGIQNFNYFIIFFTLLPMLRGICRRVLAKPRKFLKDHEKYCIARN